MSIAEDAGRLFEAGFMIGVIRALKVHINSPSASLTAYYTQQVREYPIAQVIEEFAKQTPSQRDALRILGRFYMVKGKLAGYHMVREYIEGILTDYPEGFLRNKAARQLRLEYWQCSLLGRNQLGPELLPNEEKVQRAKWLLELNLTPEQLAGTDYAKGGFLNADLILLFHDTVGTYHHLLTVDASAFGPGRMFQDVDFTSGSALLNQLTHDILYQANRGASARLSFSTPSTTIPLFDTSLIAYFSAFASTDRETAKVIQAGIYAYGFRDLAIRHTIINPDRTRYTVIGYSDRGMNSLVLTGHEVNLLADFTAIYRDGRGIFKDSDDSLARARELLLRYIGRNVLHLFPQSKKFLKDLHDTQMSQGTLMTHFDEILYAKVSNSASQQTYQGTAAALKEDQLQMMSLFQEAENAHAHESKSWYPDARWAHKQLVKKGLQSSIRYLFLTGNPGIGKTTAIIEALKENCIKEGFLLLYASPRTAVNNDIIEKFRHPIDRTFSIPHFLGFETNSTLIKANGDHATVRYFSDTPLQPEHVPGIQCIPADNTPNRATAARQNRFHRSSDRSLHSRSTPVIGVIKSLSRAIAATISLERPNAIVASAAIQAYRMNTDKTNTLNHFFDEVFKFAREGQMATVLNHGKMEQMAKTTKYLYFMIDEITGDSAGYKFFDALADLIEEYQLEQYGFRVIIIIADASLAGVPLVKEHLRRHQNEPDSRKIYLTRIPPEQVPDLIAPVASQSFAFDTKDDSQCDALLINSNTFPASELGLHYHIQVPQVTVPVNLPFDEQRYKLSSIDLDQQINEQLVKDIGNFLHKYPDRSEQAIVYVQDKARLNKIITGIQLNRVNAGLAFTADEDYMEIHADVDPQRRKLIEKTADRDRFLVFFITSSASRGLTFAKARTIFIDIPRFHMESNLMEIIQALYRGRGGKNDHRRKDITFYLSHTLVVSANISQAEVQWKRREALLDIFTMLGLVKMSLLTRMNGAVSLNSNWYSVIPIGGKSVAGTSRAFHQDIARLGKLVTSQLKSQHKFDPHLQTIGTAVEKLMGRCDIQLDRQSGSYLSLYDQADPDTIDTWLQSEGELRRAYVLGELLIVPTNKLRQQITHYMPVPETIQHIQQPKLREAIATITTSFRYTDNLVAGANDLQSLIAELTDAEHMQELEELSQENSGYYVIPIAIFVAKSSIHDYCQQLSGNDDTINGLALKNALIQLVRDVYPIDTCLPIGWKFPDFPYLLITSNDLAALRAKIWKVGHIVMTPEMNILSMLLATYEENNSQ